VDFHVHLDNSTIEKVMELSSERGSSSALSNTPAPRKTNIPTVLCNDEELAAYIRKLDGKPLFKGVQAEWTDWMRCFSTRALAQLD